MTINISGGLHFIGGATVTNVPAPAGTDDAANKSYVDDLLAPPPTAASLIYGSGADGDVVIDGYVLLDGAKQYNNLTLTAGSTLSTRGCPVFVKGTLTLENGARIGMIAVPGIPNNQSTGLVYASCASNGNGSAAGSPGGSVSVSLGGSGGRGGDGGVGALGFPIGLPR